VNVVLLCWGSLGDTVPFLRLASVLRLRGHDVTLGGNGYFAPLASRIDVDFAELSSAEEYEAFLNQPLRRMYSIWPGLARKAYEIIEQHHIPGETILAAPSPLFGARLAQEKLQTPLTTVYLAPLTAHLGVGDWRSRFMTLPLDLMWRSPVNRFRLELGLPPIKRLFPWCNSPESAVALYPGWFAPSGSAISLGFPPAQESTLFKQQDEELETFLARGDPPMVFTWPSYLTHKAREHKFIELAVRMGRRAIFVGPISPRMAHLPAGMIHRESVDYASLLPRAALHVHHGGMGTLAVTLAAGIPQVTIALQPGQFMIGQHLRRLGVSLNIRPRALRTRKGVRKIRELLESDEVVRRCRDYAERCRQEDGLLNLSLALERLHARTSGKNPMATS
jgi:rhamnosyltransferase subunit B